MSNRPNPVALTSAMLMDRARMMVTVESGIFNYEEALSNATVHEIAALASDLHRLAPACKRQAEAECNGEFRDGQRLHIESTWTGGEGNDEHRNRVRSGLQELDQAIQSAGARLDRRLARLNERLLPLALVATREGDPRGCCLTLASTDTARPVPRNGMSDEWGIA